MKKTLLTTTALGLFAAGSAFAAGPTVTVGGYADFQVGNGDQASLFQSQNNNGTIYSRDLHTRTDTEVHISVDGKADNGLGYGAYLELEADVNQDDSTGANDNKERGYIYVESGFGRVELGNGADAGSSLKVGAESLARATGGIAGDFYKYVDLSDDSAATNDLYYILPGLPTEVGLPGEANKGTTTQDTHYARATANKITYFTPRIQGVQAGVSYTPDQAERGTADGFSGENNDGGVQDVWNLGLNYEGQFGDVGVKAAATGEFGSAEDNGNTPTTRDDLKAYSIGGNLSYIGFTVGGSYGAADEYLQVATNSRELDYWTLGGAYEFGPFATSITYFSSEVKNGTAANLDNEFTNLSIGADYQLAPGLVPYVEVSFFDTDDNVADTSTTTDNDGTVIIVGTELTF